MKIIVIESKYNKRELRYGRKAGVFMRIGKENFIVQLQLHNEKALEFLVMEHGERLISIIRKHLFTLPHLQEECLTDTFVTVWNHIDSFDRENEFENWIGSVARYRCLKYLAAHQNEATIAWLIEKEILEEKEMMVSCLNEQEQELFYRFYVGEEPEQTRKKNRNISCRNMYDLLNRVDTDIFEYEKECISPEEKERMIRQLQEMLRGKKRRFSFRHYLSSSFRKAAPLNC